MNEHLDHTDMTFGIIIFVIGFIMTFSMMWVAVRGGDSQKVIDEFCPQGPVNHGWNMYCEGKLFACSQDKCEYIYTQTLPSSNNETIK